MHLLFSKHALEQPETVHTLLLQKSSSAFCLVVWGERFTGGEDEVTFMFECAHDTVNIYDVTQGTEVVQVLRDITSFSYTLSDHPVVFEVIN